MTRLTGALLLVLPTAAAAAGPRDIRAEDGLLLLAGLALAALLGRRRRSLPERCD